MITGQNVKKLEDAKGINVLINNAQASSPGAPLIKTTKEPFDLSIYSGAGLFGNEGQSACASAKEGIRGLSRAAANE